MKTSLKLVWARFLCAFVSNLHAQEKGSFKQIDLNELKHTVLNQQRTDQGRLDPVETQKSFQTLE